jgi:hypothetical protein
MKKTVLISAVLMLCFAVSINPLKEWRVKKNTQEVQRLEKRLRETKDDFYLYHSVLLATRISSVCDDLKTAEKRLVYWKSYIAKPVARDTFIYSMLLFLCFLGIILVEENKKMMKNDYQIDKICLKEGKIMLIKEWLGVLFFVAAIIVAIVYYKAISFAVNVPDPLFAMKYDRISGAIIIITLAIFAGLLIAGYLYNRALTKKLDKLWERKKLLF